MNESTPRRLASALIVLFVFVLVMLVFGAIASIIAPAEAHVEPAPGSTNDNPDSVRVQLEIDADNDGTWEVRHVFNDKAGVWDRSTQGWLRCTITNEYSEPGIPDTSETNQGIFWRDLQPDAADSMGKVGLHEFSAFGMGYNRPKVILDNGAKMWEAWYINPDNPADSTLTGTFYWYPALPDSTP